MNKDERMGYNANLSGLPFDPEQNLDWQLGWENAQSDRMIDEEF